MSEAAPLAAWEGYYVIVGTSAGALTGLQFVVMTLIADRDRPSGAREIAAFGSPTVVHFCSALLVSAVVAAPWPGPRSAGSALVVAGLAGLAYAAIVFRRARRTTTYQPVFEDWLWHTILPAVAYLLVLVGGAGLVSPSGVPPFLVAAAALLLVFIGIHNSWDTVTYLTVESPGTRVDPLPPPALPARERTPPIPDRETNELQT